MSTDITDLEPLFEIETLLGLTVVTAKDAAYRQPQVANQLRRQLMAFAKAAKPSRVIVSFENLKIDSIFSSFLGAFLGFRSQIQPDGGQVAICKVSEVLDQAMAVSDPKQQMFRRFATLGQAWDWLRSLGHGDEAAAEVTADTAAGRLFEVASLRNVRVVSLNDAEFQRPQINEELKRQLREFVAQDQPRRVLFNFENFRYPIVYSLFAGAVLSFEKKELIPLGGKAAICNMPELVRETFRVFDPQQKMLRRCDTLGQAYDWLRSLDD